MNSLLKFTIALAICSAIFADQTVYCSRSSDAPENGSIIEYVDAFNPTDSSKIDAGAAQVEEATGSVEYSECVSNSEAIEVAKKKLEVERTTGCVCKDNNNEQQSEAAKVVEKPSTKVDPQKSSKTQEKKSKKNKSVSKVEANAGAPKEAAISGLSNSKVPDSIELDAAKGDDVNPEAGSVDSLKEEEEKAESEEQKEEEEVQKSKEEKLAPKKKDQQNKDKYANDKKRSKRNASGKEVKGKNNKSYKRKGQNKNDNKKKSKGTKGKK